jgi:large subunit ribosomal protein L31
MKTEIHPKYFENVKIACQSCGTIFLAGSTTENLKTEICSACHPFYTGKRRIVDAEGRADKFLKKMDRAKLAKQAKLKSPEAEENEEPGIVEESSIAATGKTETKKQDVSEKIEKEIKAEKAPKAKKSAKPKSPSVKPKKTPKPAAKKAEK